MYLLYRWVGNTRLDCCSIFPIACLLLLVPPPSLLLFHRPYTSVWSVSHPLSISARLPSAQECFNVQPNLSEAINTRSVVIPADLQMELLILLSLLPPPPPPPPHLRPPFSSSGTILVDSFLWTLLLALPFVVRVLSVPCCSSNKNRDEKNKKKTHKKMNKQIGLSEAGKQEQSCGMDHS